MKTSAAAVRPSGASLPRLDTAMGFDEAAALVLQYLHTELPMAVWMLNRKDGDRIVISQVRSGRNDITQGYSSSWEDSLCARMVEDGAPPICSDLRADPIYRTSPTLETLDLHSYAGVPVTDQEGDLFGTLCGIDFTEADLDQDTHLPLLQLLAGLLGVVLAADRARIVAERVRGTAELAAHTDALTGLHNRRAWDQALASEQDRLRRVADPGSVVVVDLDGLKEVNDRQGHAAGDELLRRCAEVLRRNVRHGDLAARIGGDEFALLFVEGSAQDIDRRAEGLHEALVAAGVSASVGTARFGVGTTITEAVEQADRRMYERKRRRAGSRHNGP